MSEVAPLISDLAIILIIAGIVTVIFKWLKQPVILGYIVAGIMAGPSVSLVPTVSDPANIKIWADIGVIFLLFAMGLDFSFKKLINVGITAIVATVTIVCGMMFIGYTAGNAMGFSHMSSIFLGGMLSMSSTAIVFKAFNDMGLLQQKFTGIVLGILVIEDLVAVVMMVVLSTLAVGKHFEGKEMLESILKLAAFLIFWSALGIYLIPTLLKKIRRFTSNEILLITSLGLCLGMVMIATKAGFSAALGAFVMGSLLAETVEAEKIVHIVQPVKDLFASIFFVSVGMMIDPAMMWEYAVPILILTLLVLSGQVLFGSFGVLLSGQPLKIAIQSGFSLTQVGEFAFIIASLGVSLNVTDKYLYPVIVAVSVITTFLTPYMIRLSEPAYRFIDIHMHIESSMTTPVEFSRTTLPYGVTTVVADAHEIANVFGMEGIKSFMSQKTEQDIFWAIPSSVPATNEELETPGAALYPEDAKKMASDSGVLCLGEIMNFKDLSADGYSKTREMIRLCKRGAVDAH